ncbi:Zn-ribbon domain-containing OB-fold protein [Hydrogenophaga sp. BPS33]|uniref:Zn-ribbon domain-containing OB-fold protein n=1 Tax=Hydrogenophaga sp. BPS33 TaxID=2651974 RepID=UPI00131FFA35|nr:OB-fold domain-containing protein [Hydrogenophaga sp. BPS33]QHE85025.1 OB-fold domain-containing protein [Hydrogenophaga sp. BPS33]
MSARLRDFLRDFFFSFLERTALRLPSQGHPPNWAEASGEGTAHSWTVAHHAFHPAFAGELPYTLVTVDLKEGVRALGRWREGCTPSVGMAVRGGFEPREDGVDLVFQAVAG